MEPRECKEFKKTLLLSFNRSFLELLKCAPDTEFLTAVQTIKRGRSNPPSPLF
jgi:hypothetical protein